MLLAIVMALSLIVIGLPGGINPFTGSSNLVSADSAKVSIERAEKLEDQIAANPKKTNAQGELILARITAGNNLIEIDDNGQQLLTDDATEDVYKRQGRDRATSLGDMLFSTAFRILVDGDDVKAVAEISDTAVDLARGELMQRRGAFNTSLEETEYLDRCRLKTARLFEAACVLGRDSVGGGDGDVVALFGHRIGLAFQMLDDVLGRAVTLAGLR